MQDVSDFHHNLPDWSRSLFDEWRLVYIIPTVNQVFEILHRGMPENLTLSAGPAGPPTMGGHKKRAATK
jgi:hypothetical protein